MTLLVFPPEDPGRKKNDRTYAQIALLGAVPAIMVAAPAVGYFLGYLLDKKLDSDPIFKIVGAILGFIAAGKEIYRLVKRAQALDKDSDTRNDGT